jgi:hypothetical protein
VLQLLLLGYFDYASVTKSFNIRQSFAGCCCSLHLSTATAMLLLLLLLLLYSDLLA